MTEIAKRRPAWPRRRPEEMAGADGEAETNVFTTERLEAARLFSETVISEFTSSAGIELTERMRTLRQSSPVHGNIQWAENTKLFLASASPVETPEGAFDLLYFRTRDLADGRKPLLIEDMLIMLHAIFRFSFGQFRRIDDLQGFGSLQKLFELLKKLHKDPNMRIDDFSTETEPHLRQINIFFARMREQGVRSFPAPQDKAGGKYA